MSARTVNIVRRCTFIEIQRCEVTMTTEDMMDQRLDGRRKRARKVFEI
jgi:hypothetical protein